MLATGYATNFGAMFVRGKMSFLIQYFVLKVVFNDFSVVGRVDLRNPFFVRPYIFQDIRSLD